MVKYGITACWKDCFHLYTTLHKDILTKPSRSEKMVTILTQKPLPYSDEGPCTTDQRGWHNPKNTDAIFAVIESRRINIGEKLEALVNFVNIGLNVNTKNNSGETPLICCVRKRFLDGCRVLVEAGCGVNIQDKTDSTALHYCFMGSVEASVELVQILLEFGANPNIKDNSGTTPMHLALVCGKKDVFQKMVTYNGDLSELQAQNCVDLIKRFGFRLNFDTEVMFQRLYRLGCPLFECRKIIQLLKLWDIECSIASAYLDKITDAVPPLTELSRLKVRKCLRKRDLCGDLHLPPCLQRFIRIESLGIKTIELVKTFIVQDPLSVIPNR